MVMLYSGSRMTIHLVHIMDLVCSLLVHPIIALLLVPLSSGRPCWAGSLVWHTYNVSHKYIHSHATVSLTQEEAL